ncbi:fimbrial protein [Enterobacter sp. CC120223-11]|uniref:fimbrial protein n=1 Tax=Enterobacter sp. CC120223-11 TaxID=1378073 RepID=UPI000BD69651|nr:fimbrial protein [Enterobacter sp. CC120223-11]SNY61480.1 Pilin (type 1 fimbria component protein) [Enterobacter sp. CC120223-11]
MNKRHYLTILLAGLILQTPAQGYDVLISVMGNLIGNTCDVSADTKNQTVPLGTIGSRQFRTAGSMSNVKSWFTLGLENCGPTFTGARVRFTGTPDPANAQWLKTADGGTDGIALSFFDADNQPVPLNTQTKFYGKAGDSQVEMKFYARMVATLPSVEPGDVSAMATWLVEYQ